MPNTKLPRPASRVRRASAGVIALALAASDLHAQQPAAVSPRPTMRFGRLTSAVVGTPDVVAAAADSAAVARALGACGLPDAAPGAEAATRDALPSPVEPTRLVILIVPVPMLPPRCDFAAANDPALLARGIRVAAHATQDARHDLRTAVPLVRHRPLPVEPARAFAVTTVAESPASAAVAAPTALALSVPLELLAPDAGGALPEVVVRVTWADSALPPEDLVIWKEQVREAWLHALPSRVARTRVDGAAPPVQLPAPADGALRAAHARWAGGDMREGAQLALARLRERTGDGSLARADLRVARLMVATTLLAHGDSAAARLLFADVAADAPCLTMASAPAAWRRQFEAVRPPARCTTLPTRRLALASLVPGLGQELAGRRRSALLIAGATAAFAASVIPLDGRADRTYDRYMDERSPEEARRLHDRATGERASAHVMAGLAAATWMLSALDAVRTERRHRRELERTRDFDARLTVGFAPPAPGSPARAGVALAW